MNQPEHRNIHETEDRLELYALGRLPEEDVAAVEEHLLVCDSCRESAEAARDYSVAMREVLAEAPAAEQVSAAPWYGFLLQPRFALGAGFAIVVLAIGLSWTGVNTRIPAVATLQLTAMRGEMTSVDQAKALTLVLTDAPAESGRLELELVDATGAKVWNAAAAGGSARLEATIPQRLSPGDYFVRLNNSSGKLLHEYGFHVR